MSALGFVLIGIGLLTGMAALQHQMIFDVLRSIIGAPIPKRSDTGKLGG